VAFIFYNAPGSNATITTTETPAAVAYTSCVSTVVIAVSVAEYDNDLRDNCCFSRFICYDHFTADQFESTPQRALILKRTAVPSRYEPATFVTDRHILNNGGAIKKRKFFEEQPTYINLLLTPPHISSMEFLLRNIEVYSFGKKSKTIGTNQ
ncbi:hypothetical protein GCK32_006965, partial [Trichostrongylus colubriformis]